MDAMAALAGNTRNPEDQVAAAGATVGLRDPKGVLTEEIQDRDLAFLLYGEQDGLKGNDPDARVLLACADVIAPCVCFLQHIFTGATWASKALTKERAHFSIVLGRVLSQQAAVLRGLPARNIAFYPEILKAGKVLIGKGLNRVCRHHGI